MKMMLIAALASAAFVAVPALAQQAPGAPEAAQSSAAAAQSAPRTGGNTAGATIASVDNVRVNQLIIYGDQKCPQSTDDEIVVCYKPQDNPYRIPAPLRETPGPASNSWANRAMELQYVGRRGIGSCSPDGPGGATGCLVQFINQARAERQGGEQVNWNALIEQARQERLGRIDADSEEIERQEVERERGQQPR